MSNKTMRAVHDSMGELLVPEDACWGAQTQRAIDNFHISDWKMPRRFIQAMGLIKAGCASANQTLGTMDLSVATSIIKASSEVSKGVYDKHFPLDVFQTGSATSTNMNANEVIAFLASKDGIDIHPNDHVNMGQSSNDVIPTAIHLSACLGLHQDLIPSLEHLTKTIEARASELKNVTKTGRTHLMDAMPVTLGQELGGWAAQLHSNLNRIKSSLPRLEALGIGGTAVGTGINADPKMRGLVCEYLKKSTNINLVPANNLFEALSSQDAAVEMSGQLKTLAVSLMKIANDLRWMNSGPLAGLSEIALPSLQPGSSIMPGKVNPVIPEAMAMVCAQVIGHDAAITIGGQSGNFQLNVMLPMIAYNLLQSISLLSNAMRALADKAIHGFTVNHENIQAKLACNPILVTALNSVIGYELGAKIAKTAYKEGKPLKEVALAMTSLSEADLDRLLDPKALTEGGIKA